MQASFLIGHILENPPNPKLYSGKMIRDEAESIIGLMRSICYGGNIDAEMSKRLQHLLPLNRHLLGGWIIEGCQGKEDFELEPYKNTIEKLLSGKEFRWVTPTQVFRWPSYHPPATFL